MIYEVKELHKLGDKLLVGCSVKDQSGYQISTFDSLYFVRKGNVIYFVPSKRFNLFVNKINTNIINSDEFVVDFEPVHMQHELKIGDLAMSALEVKEKGYTW